MAVFIKHPILNLSEVKPPKKEEPLKDKLEVPSEDASKLLDDDEDSDWSASSSDSDKPIKKKAKKKSSKASNGSPKKKKVANKKQKAGLFPCMLTFLMLQHAWAGSTRVIPRPYRIQV